MDSKKEESTRNRNKEREQVKNNKRKNDQKQGKIDSKEKNWQDA